MSNKVFGSLADVPIFQVPLSAKPQITAAGKVRYVRKFSEAYAACPPYIWWMHVFHFETGVRIDGRPYHVRPGAVTLVGPGTQFGLDYSERGTCLFAHIRMDAPENGRLYPIRAVQELGENFQALSDEFESAIARFHDDPVWADVTLWNILFRLTDRAQAGDGAHLSRHSVVASIVQHIDVEIGFHLTTGYLTGRVGMSSRHINKLFNREFGMSLMEYVRHRRVEAAFAMLTKTRLPITLIAADVGLPDLSHFNRLLRKEYGESPREIRKKAWEIAPPEQTADTIEAVRRPHFYYQF